MPTITIGLDEKFPVFWWEQTSPNPTSTRNFQSKPVLRSVHRAMVSDRTLERWAAAADAYMTAQAELATLYKQTTGDSHEEH